MAGQKNTSDIIEAYLRKLLEEAQVIEIKRADLANQFDVVPSQINYVIKTRFTASKGFDVESVLKENRSSSIKGHNISIKNTNQRLKMIFGEAYGVELESEPDVKTIASIRLPILTQPYFKEELNKLDPSTDS